MQELFHSIVNLFVKSIYHEIDSLLNKEPYKWYVIYTRRKKKRRRNENQQIHLDNFDSWQFSLK